MKKLALGALFAGLAACGGGTNNPMIIDGTPGGGDGGGACNPLMQTGCNAGEKCTWINDQDNPPIGHVGCAPDGTIAVGQACTPPTAGPMGWDECASGSVCLSGECKQICDVNGGSPTCDANHSCTRYADFFEVGGTTVAGVCDPACDPLTQELKVGSVPACGSPDPLAPTLGCYGFDDYSCAPGGMSTWMLTDRQPPRTNPAGNPYLNGCAPGFIPFFFAMTGSTMTLCSGLCAALETDNQNVGNADGDATAIGKLPTQAAKAGDATCGIGKKGSANASECRFIYPYVADDQGMFLPSFEQNHIDRIGICFKYDEFQYDSNGDMMPDADVPSCTQLVPGAGDVNNEDDGAADWPGCLKLSSLPSAFTKKDSKMMRRAQDFYVPKNAPMELIRHNLK